MAIVLTDVEVRAAMEKGDAGIKALLVEVDELTQARFYHVGVTSVTRFAAFATTTADLQAVLRANFELDPADSIAARVRTANVVIAFELAKLRVVEVAKVEAEMQTRRLPRPMPATEYSLMRSAWENRFWTLEDKECPAMCYLEKRSQDLEQGEFRAELLSTVLNREQDDSDSMVPVWDATGQVKLRKAGTTIGEPSSPEQLRARLHILGIGIAMLGMRHTNRLFLQNFTANNIHKYLDYLLGDFVFNLVGKSAEGHTISAPSWEQILLYEMQIRREAWKAVAKSQATEPITFGEALKAACDNSVVKERYFTTPTALMSSASHGPIKQPAAKQMAINDGSVIKLSKKAKAKAKAAAKAKAQAVQGAGKGVKPKGQGRSSTTGCPWQSPDGINLCFAYNDPEKRCKDPNCSRIKGHLCGLCFMKHPMYQCRGRASGKGETQGAMPLEDNFPPVQ
jgi:hypothetical protein